MSVAAGTYEIGDRIGGGGMAEVFRARALGAEGFARPVAIKRVLPRFSQNEKFAEMFVNEARIASLLTHPNIVSVLNFARDNERRLFLVMELVEGVDLFALLTTGRVPLDCATFIISEVLKALAYAHARTDRGQPLGIVHRDISPQNVLLSWDGAVKVSDFGLAKAVAVSERSMTGSVKGKLGYLSPEQLRSDTLDGRSDLFSAGIILHELLTGEPLFTGRSDAELLTQMISMRIPPPSAKNKTVPPALDEVCLTLLKRDRDERYPDAAAALAALAMTGTISPLGAISLTRLLQERFPDRPMTGGFEAISLAPPPGASPASPPKTPTTVPSPPRNTVLLTMEAFEQAKHLAFTTSPDPTQERPAYAESSLPPGVVRGQDYRAEDTAVTNEQPPASLPPSLPPTDGPPPSQTGEADPTVMTFGLSDMLKESVGQQQPPRGQIQTEPTDDERPVWGGPSKIPAQPAAPPAPPRNERPEWGTPSKIAGGGAPQNNERPEWGTPSKIAGGAAPRNDRPEWGTPSKIAGGGAPQNNERPEWGTPSKKPGAALRTAPVIERVAPRVAPLEVPTRTPPQPAPPPPSTEPTSGGSKKGVVIAAVAAVVALGIAAAAWFVVNKRPQEPPPAPVKAPYVVSLDITPQDATVEIDGTPVGTGPVYIQSFPRDGKQHSVRIAAKGYVPVVMPFQDAPPASGKIVLAPAEVPDAGVAEPPDAGAEKPDTGHRRK